jgi:hypothetical protein
MPQCKILQATKKSISISDKQKVEVSNFFIQLLESFLEKLQTIKPNKEYNYVTDIYTKWHRNYFYFCEKNKAEYENRMRDEFETKFVRLEFMAENSFNFSYFRHTGQWHLVAENIPLEKCEEMIKKNPNFQPLF